MGQPPRAPLCLGACVPGPWVLLCDWAGGPMSAPGHSILGHAQPDWEVTSHRGQGPTLGSGPETSSNPGGLGVIF